MNRPSQISPALALVAVLAVSGTPSAGIAQDLVSGPARVIDGDTVEIRGRRVRLHGIDAPERTQTCTDAAGRTYGCGRVAADALASMMGRSSVTCQARDTDRHGRLVAVCSRDGVDLNALMVSNGHALAYRRFSIDYVAHENAARARRLGVWQGPFAAPWDWRRPQDGGSSVSPSSRRNPAASGNERRDCAIKGNVSRSGARIYHVPGGASYDATRISEDKGERWFCSEAEARDAGWRRARR
ncbi:MAG: thermonuclease family protein [Gammaproteobacteria bacterium]|nr:thermonuclease family protein [Gammaproteobacteria bacterium]